ncbi:hypothetical protein D9619_003767 [Psilocybe cf. subviscida]|uniref:NAD-dependent epimerase/dehydratase domain-containing protein n=1 Tax=Psilocybe cf. subviscida TaxID=2480587 RepID=A0A8H5AWM3_9AGAR|nr:hypothetical protein D9619_003767 [Psilocybe cf. subviscida]
MPTISKGDKILVSGANGYIAVWIVRILLERGYSVRGTVRGTSKGEYLKNYFTALGYGDKFEYVIVEDIAKEGAFDEAVKGVDGIAHAASPFHDKAKTPADMFDPAIQGTVGMLQSARKNGPNVKRVVITSSCGAVMSPPPVPTTFTEKDWNTQSPKEVEEQGNSSPPMTIYRASKVLAERSAWAFYEEHKSEVKWDLTVINPPFVFGPFIHEASSPENLNTSLHSWWKVAVENTPKTKEFLSISNAWVDVRDTSLAHVLALETEKAGGERIITSSGPYNWQDWIDVVNSIKPSPLPSHTFPTGIPEVNTGEKVYLINYDPKKEKELFGIKFHTQLETVKDTLEDFAKRGW